MSDPYGLTWWIGMPQQGWTARCDSHFDVRLSTKYRKPMKAPANTSAAAMKLGRFRSASATAAKAGVMRQGFGLSQDRKP
jgi:hypothetical protein